MNMKRFLSVLLILAMLVCTVPAFAILATAEDETASSAWDGTSYDVSWCDTADSGAEIDGKKYKVTGYTAEEAKTYEISTAEQLAGLAKLVNTYKGDSFANVTVYLTADVDLGGNLWTMIGKNGTTFSATCAFAGSFVGKKTDGSNAVISNLTVSDGSTSQYCVGLFGLYRGPLMANLTLKNAVIESGYGRTGSFVGTAGVAATFRNLTSDAKITMTATTAWTWTCAGGLFGTSYNKTDGSGNVFENCVFTGSIGYKDKNTKVQGCGGIVGFNEGVATFKNCIVTGNISGVINGIANTGDNRGNPRSGVGGILGAAVWADGKAAIGMENCYVSATLAGFQRVGGFIGSLFSTPGENNANKFTNCQFDGAVVSNGGDAKAAFLGYQESNGANPTFENCLNTGVASCRSSGSLKMGLVSGNPTATFTNCYGTYKALLKTGATETTGLTESGKLPADFDATVWEAREGSYPVLKNAKAYANADFLTADLSWIDAADMTKAVWIDTEAELLGAFRMFETDSWVLGDRKQGDAVFNNMMNVQFSGAVTEWLKKAPYTADTAFGDIAGKWKMPMKTEGTENAETVKGIYYQTTTAINDGKYGVRIAAEIKGSDWDKAEFRLVASYTDAAGNTKISALRKEEITVCYKSLLETIDGTTTPATPAAGYVWIVLDIGKISADYTDVSFDLYASVTDATGTYYNAVYAVSISAPAAQ